METKQIELNRIERQLEENHLQIMHEIRMGRDLTALQAEKERLFNLQRETIRKPQSLLEMLISLVSVG